MWSAFSRRIVNLCTRRHHESGRERAPKFKKGSPILTNDSNSNTRYTMPITNINDEEVSQYLTTHPEFLERYVMDEVEVEQLERWIIRKSQRLKKKTETAAACRNGRKTSLSRWKFCVHADKRQMLQDLTHSLQLRPTKDHVLWELANCICSAVSADGFRLYVADKDDPENLCLFLGPECKTENGEPRLQRIKNGVVLPGYVASRLEPVRYSRGDCDSRFPDGIPNEGEMAHFQCQPIIQPDGQLVAVLELLRREAGGPFYEEDEEIASSYLVWGGIALHYAHLYLNMNKQKRLNDFLLAVVKSIFQDMVSMDALVIKIMNFAQRLVDADRASLFLVDAKNQELYATIFDVGIENQEEDDGKVAGDTEEFLRVHTSKEIRFPLGTGIAGQVAMTGEVLNIKDAYADTRFNRTVDQLTGYQTKTILCMPIFIRGSVIGVVQMVNKHVGCFTSEDVDAFEMFAVYCGLALHHAKLYDKIRKSEQKYKVALEVLSYHNTCTEEELQCTQTNGLKDNVAGIDDYYFNPFKLEDYDKARHAIYMFVDLFGANKFDECSLLKFTLTVKKNYRRVPYHNWTHGFSVANCMYCILKHTKDVFKPMEALALFTASLCHDLDHRGKNNKFMSDTESPLAAIYSTSTMEHHHFNQTVTILQQEGHNIFCKLSHDEYKEVLSLLKHCILATDLAVFFPNKAKLSKLVQENSFDWHDQEHRLLIQAISMTGSDLSASAKPWDIQSETVKVIFEEFYQQGDAERANGKIPIPMMDRKQPDHQPASQVGFLMGICEPCYALLDVLLPETRPLLEMCRENLERWRQIDKSIQEKDN